MKHSILLIVGLLFTLIISAQENTAHHWYFGENAGIDFSTGIPIAKTDGQITGWEGCATVGDMNGNLLFYTDGQEVYNKNHNVMENGDNLMGHWSSAQSSIIIRLPGNNNEYYIFTTDDSGEQHLANGWRYSIVDMSLNNGLGAVTEVKNILLEEMVTERQVAIMHGNNINVWIIAHKWNSNEFVAYEISNEGISDTPVISAIGTVHQGGYSPTPLYNGWTNGVGIMKTTKEGDKIALSIQIMGIFELFDFDKNTGIISNCHTSPAYTTAYGVEFSPDGTKLYTTHNIYATSVLSQFNLLQDNPFNNPVIIANESYQNRGMQLGPNGKIYITHYLGNHLAVINNPNEEGTACGYESNAVFLEGKICRSGLPSLFFYKGLEFFTGSELDTTICNGDSIFIQNTFQTQTGTYFDTIQSCLGWDSILNIHLSVLPAPLIPEISENEGVLTSNNALYYQWYYNGNIISGATNQSYQPIATGDYQVEVKNEMGCSSISDIYYFEYLNIPTANDNSIAIYPNPFNKFIDVEPSRLCSIKIIDVNGKVFFVKEQINNKCRINLNHLPQGIYFIEITYESNTVRKKLIKY